MTALSVFTYTDREVRTVLIDGEPWFVAADVCKALGIGNTSMAVSRLDGDGVSSTEVIDSLGRTQSARTINESGLYELIFQSRVPGAKEFKRWVTHEVLPSIRKTGQYGNLPTRKELALLVLAAEAEIEAKDRRIAELEPDAAIAQNLMNATGDWQVGHAAKILTRDPMIEIGRQRLFGVMHELGWIFRSGFSRTWEVKQAALKQGLVAELPMTHKHPKTGVDVIDPPQVRVTAKGLRKLHAHLGGTRPLEIEGAA